MARLHKRAIVMHAPGTIKVLAVRRAAAGTGRGEQNPVGLGVPQGEQCPQRSWGSLKDPRKPPPSLPLPPPGAGSGAGGGCAMLSKKKYNVNGDPGMKAQVRAGSRYRKAVFSVKKSSSFPLRALASLLSPPLLFPQITSFWSCPCPLLAVGELRLRGAAPRAPGAHVSCWGCSSGLGKPGWKRDVPHLDVGHPQKPFSLLAWDPGCLGSNCSGRKAAVFVRAQRVGRLNPSCSFPRLCNLSS